MIAPEEHLHNKTIKKASTPAIIAVVEAPFH